MKAALFLLSRLHIKKKKDVYILRILRREKENDHKPTEVHSSICYINMMSQKLHEFHVFSFVCYVIILYYQFLRSITFSLGLPTEMGDMYT